MQSVHQIFVNIYEREKTKKSADIDTMSRKQALLNMRQQFDRGEMGQISNCCICGIDDHRSCISITQAAHSSCAALSARRATWASVALTTSRTNW